MNKGHERIKELIEQAGPLQEVLSMIHEQTNNIGPRYIRNLALLDFQLERFAELIVRECASKVIRNEALNIFEHFGVKE